MNSRKFVIALALGLVLGTGVAIALDGSSIFTLGRSTEAVGPGIAAYTAEPLNEPTTPSPAWTSTSSPTEAPPTVTPTLIPLDVGSEKGQDLEDVLLLYDSTRVSTFDYQFCKVAEYYGLLCKRIALDDTDLTADLLRDAQGGYFKLVGIGADTFLQSPSLVTNHELGIIKTAIETEGVNLLVSKMNSYLDPTLLVKLTDGAVLGATQPKDSSRDWSVSSAAPEITREFTGQVISTDAELQEDLALTLGQQGSLTTLITSTEDTGVAYPIFIRWKKGTGSIFIDAGESLEELPLRELYYDVSKFSQIVPLMLTIRYALGDETWHNDHDYANLTIDDPALIEPFRNLSFEGLLREMRAHNFHTTIAFIPANWDKSERTVAGLFRANRHRYSLVQHGNNHDGYEFYKYSVSEDDEYEGKALPARPLADQEADIVEGLGRMERHRRLTFIPYDRVMIFPWGISPEPTLVLLKKHNFLATVNGQDLPLGTTRPPDWDYGMYQANMDYGSFPTLVRRHPGAYQPFQPRLQPFIFDLFLDKPALFYSHSGQLFESGIDAFGPVADEVNELSGEVEWRSLGYIVRHLHLEKRNDDGSVDVKMYGNHLTVTNGSSQDRNYHISKAETLNVPISRLTVNGHQFPYRVEETLLSLDVSVPARSSLEILIHYGDLD